MAYSRSNPPHIVSPAGLTSGKALWVYTSEDPHATVSGSEYFTDGRELGMKVGDPVIVIDTNAGTTTMHHVTDVVVPPKNPGGFDLVPGTIAAATISAATLS